MIVEVRNMDHQTMSAVVDPFDILCKLSCDWRESIGVQRGSQIMGGYWMKYVGDESEDIMFTRLRLATREEIVRFDAFKNLAHYTAIYIK